MVSHSRGSKFRITSYVKTNLQLSNKWGALPMTNRQKFKRVLYSHYGVLTLLSLLLVVYILSFFEFPTKGGQQGKDNPLYVVVYFLVLICPLGFFFWGWEKFDDEDRIKRFRENPDLQKELKQGESLIDFLYEDEHEEKM